MVLERITGKHADRKASWEPAHRWGFPLCQAGLLSFAVFASDKSAFCKIQYSFYDVPSIQRESGCSLSRQQGTLAHVNTGLGWASLSGDTVVRCTVTLLPTEGQRCTSARVEDCSLLDKQTSPQDLPTSSPGYQYLSMMAGHINVVKLCPNKEGHSFWTGAWPRASGGNSFFWSLLRMILWFPLLPVWCLHKHMVECISLKHEKFLKYISTSLYYWSSL